MYTIEYLDDWVRLCDPSGEVIAEGHYLNVDDILDALNLPYIKKYEMGE